MCARGHWCPKNFLGGSLRSPRCSAVYIPFYSSNTLASIFFTFLCGDVALERRPQQREKALASRVSETASGLVRLGWRRRCTPTGGVETVVAVGAPSRADGIVH